MVKRRLALAVWLCGVALGPAIAAAGAATADALAQFEAANRLYEQGRFAEAARGYEAILKGGSFSPAVYFNLGNARFKAGELGRAVVAYRRICVSRGSRSTGRSGNPRARSSGWNG